MSEGARDLAAVYESVGRVIADDSTLEPKLKAIAELLRLAVPHYDWVGFYLADPERERELILGPYAGEPTEHTRIPFGRGACGRVAESLCTLLIPDVSREENYLSCSVKVKSEIVVPILKAGRFVAQMDIDSHAVNAFTDADRRFLERVCAALAPLF
jgi:GAF domain-containing protein